MQIAGRPNEEKIATVSKTVHIDNSVNTIINNVTIVPWGTPLTMTDADVDAAMSRLSNMIEAPALPEMVAVLMEIVKRAHVPLDSRNVHLNPKRADQALALSATGWAALPLSEATQVLFDGASARIEKPVARGAPHQAQRVVLPSAYRVERDGAVQIGMRPMEAHLANLAPGGPGPLLIERGAEPTPARAPAQAPAPESDLDTVARALRLNPIRCEPSGALSIGWIVAASGSVKVSGPELFRAILSVPPSAPAELCMLRAAAETHSREKSKLSV